MSIERIIVNGRELTAFDMPAEPSKEYSVRVDNSNEVEVAELGRGTCKMDAFGDVRFCDADDDESNYEYGTLAECSECGAIVLMPPEYAHFDRESMYAATNYCPDCGRRVEP